MAWFQAQVVGQKDAIRAVVDAIALYKAGLHDPSRPIGSFLFVGPTGVGKTELARALAKFLFGSEDRLLRFDLSEFKDYNAYQTLIGDPGNPGQPARLVDPVRARPFQVILFDEIEKAHPNVRDLLLQLLDEGWLTPGAGKTVSFRNTIVIATSNVGAKEQAKSSPGFVTGGEAAGSERVRQALETAFRPELLNRFQHVCLFHPLDVEQVRQIAQMELRRVLARQGISGRDIAIDVAPAVLDLVVEHGYDASYGARALRRMIQRYVAVPIATLLLERPVDDGSILRLTVRRGAVQVESVETAQTRAQRAESVPIRSAFGQLTSRADIAAVLEGLTADRRALVRDFRRSETAHEADEPIDGAVVSQDVETLARIARRREVVLSCTRRLERLQRDEADIRKWLERAATREEREKLVAAMLRWEGELRCARRELVLMPAAAVSDALIELQPLASTNARAIELFGVYSGWAKRRGYAIDIVREPLDAHEPIVAAVSGHYSYGYLHLESGHHRFRGGRRNSVVRVRVVQWRDVTAEVAFSSQHALKKTGLLGGRIRSRLQVAGTDLVIQNEKTLVQNRSFASGIVPAFLDAGGAVETEVRRYDAEPFLLKDYLTGSSGRADTLAPDNFHELLARRVEVTYSGDR
ncbi:MAG TPA: AAA family ATPase [Gammaproteobacteria bacterium]|nr:AAA family ATPase [Gammaproteobacteria bacterium]